VRPDELERRLRERLDALGPAPRAELLHVLMLPDFERADRIGEFWSYTQTRTFGEILIDLVEDVALERQDGRRDGPTCGVTVEVHIQRSVQGTMPGSADGVPASPFSEDGRSRRNCPAVSPTRRLKIRRK
jgi:hypothetical protein